MKRIIIVLLLLLGYASYAQVTGGFCSTPSNHNPTIYTAKLQNNGPYVVRVALHIIRDNNGNGGLNNAEIDSLLNILHQDFSPHNICFYLVQVDEILKSNLYYAMSSNAFPILQYITSQPKAIDIYLGDSLTSMDGGSGGGIANGIPGDALIVAGNGSGFAAQNFQAPWIVFPVSRVVSHEMGHCLGLYHTFQGIGGICGGFPCAEAPNGSNCSTCGDFVCDTPADNTAWDKNILCEDAEGVVCDSQYTFTPLPNLIMDYIPPICMQLFTPGQGERMRNEIALKPVLQQVTIPQDYHLNNFTLNYPNNDFFDALDTSNNFQYRNQAGGFFNSPSRRKNPRKTFSERSIVFPQ